MKNGCFFFDLFKYNIVFYSFLIIIRVIRGSMYLFVFYRAFLGALLSFLMSLVLEFIRVSSRVGLVCEFWFVSFVRVGNVFF